MLANRVDATSCPLDYTDVESLECEFDCDGVCNYHLSDYLMVAPCIRDSFR